MYHISFHLPLINCFWYHLRHNDRNGLEERIIIHRKLQSFGKQVNDSSFFWRIVSPKRVYIWNHVLCIHDICAVLICSVLNNNTKKILTLSTLTTTMTTKIEMLACFSSSFKIVRISFPSYFHPFYPFYREINSSIAWAYLKRKW